MLLVGVLNESGSVERTITVPFDKFLFFPLINLSIDNIDEEVAQAVAEMQARAEGAINQVSELNAIINGESVVSYIMSGKLTIIFVGWVEP